MDLKDLRDWAGFAVGVLAPAIIGLMLLSSELRQSPVVVQTALAVAIALAIVEAGIILALLQFHGALKARLGLVSVGRREDLPALHAIYQAVTRSYRWHGLSATNELVGQTEVQSAIARRSSDGAEFLFVLADPQDWLRMKEQRRWEDDPTRPAERLIDNIKSSQSVIDGLKSTGARVSRLTSSQLPALRIVEVDDERIEVAHYDRRGCGFSGTHIVLKKPKRGEGMLFHWFRRAADLQRKNALIDQVYREIGKLDRDGLSGADIAALISSDIRFEDLRRHFSATLEWELAPDDVEKAVRFVTGGDRAEKAAQIA